VAGLRIRADPLCHQMQTIAIWYKTHPVYPNWLDKACSHPEQANLCTGNLTDRGTPKNRIAYQGRDCAAYFHSGAP
jgi:hypothetical protein